VKTAAKAALEPRKPSSDEHLVARCLKGDEQAWADLIDKYKNLIYSIPIKLGMYDDAADIFNRCASTCCRIFLSCGSLRRCPSG